MYSRYQLYIPDTYLQRQMDLLPQIRFKMTRLMMPHAPVGQEVYHSHSEAFYGQQDGLPSRSKNCLRGHGMETGLWVYRVKEQAEVRVPTPAAPGLCGLTFHQCQRRQHLGFLISLHRARRRPRGGVWLESYEHSDTRNVRFFITQDLYQIWESHF